MNNWPKFTATATTQTTHTVTDKHKCLEKCPVKNIHFFSLTLYDGKLIRKTGDPKINSVIQSAESFYDSIL